MSKPWEQPRYIAIEGPIRAGKSSLAALLAEHLGAQRIAEPEDNPFLDHFYRGEVGATFATQMWFLHARQRQLCSLELPPAPTPLVADYIFEKDKIFASLNLSDAELATYNRYYQPSARQVVTPDLVIYLQASPRTLKARLRRKALPGERRIADSYLEQVAQAYEHYFFHYTASNLLVVNTDELDFVQHRYDLQLLLRRLREPVRGTQYFLPLGLRAVCA
jgi:deoxyadenosine/deoxycytidine kinase